MILNLVILLSVLATSILSGILGMAGGMILMAILVSTVSVAAAMMIHGVVQATANGSRAWFLRRHIQWRILPAYLLGSGTVLGLFSAITLAPNSAVILILVGSFPWLARASPYVSGLDIKRTPTAFTCGGVVTAAQLLAGASGPLLDVFYLNTPLNRYQIIASKAITQTIGHLIKLVYYGLIIGVSESIPPWFYGIAMLTAVLGTRIGTRLLGKFNDESFKAVSGWVILAIASACIAKGVLDLARSAS